MTVIPTRDDADFAEQLAAAHDRDLDVDALTPSADTPHPALDDADPADRFEQSLIVPIADDEYPLAY